MLKELWESFWEKLAYCETDPSEFFLMVPFFPLGFARSSLLRGLLPSWGGQGLPHSCGDKLRIALASLGAEHRLQACQLQSRLPGSRGQAPVAVVHRLSRPAACGILLDQGLTAPGSRGQAPIAVVRALSCPAACGILPDQGWNLHLPHLQVHSLPLSHQGSP